MLLPFLAWFRHSKAVTVSQETLVDFDTFSKYASDLFNGGKEMMDQPDQNLLSQAAHAIAVKVRALVLLLE